MVLGGGELYAFIYVIFLGLDGTAFLVIEDRGGDPFGRVGTAIEHPYFAAGGEAIKAFGVLICLYITAGISQLLLLVVIQRLQQKNKNEFLKDN
jgi:hypothetical protein